MFGHIFKNAIRVAVKEKTSLFWSFIFPIILSTFMFLAFGNILEKDEMFHDIPVAFVESEEVGSGLRFMLEAMGEGEEAMLSLRNVNEEEAQKLLKEKEVAGIIYEKDCSLVVPDTSINSTILEEILLLYKQNEKVIIDRLTENMLSEEFLQMNVSEEEMKDIINSMVKDGSSLQEDADYEDMFSEFSERIDYYREIHFVEGNQNQYYNYFYAIFAMSCLFAAFSSVVAIGNIQADCGALGMRRNLAPTHKMLTIISEFAALVVLQFLAQCIALGYMTLLGMDFGKKIPQILLILFFGVCIGLSIGVIVGSIRKISEAGKVGICIAVGMVLSVLADLCIGGLKHQIELHVPIINRINPAALISDSFYCLGVYDDYQIFTRNLVTLGIETVVFLLIGYFMVRKTKYKEL